MTEFQNNTDCISDEYDVAIIGGGLAGLTSSILLSRAGLKTVLIEKKKYPFHRVCGEYVSNEVLPFLKKIGFNPSDHNSSFINKLRISNAHGNSIHTALPLGGFGISRYKFDSILADISRSSGVCLNENLRVTDVLFENEKFIIKTAEKVFTANVVIGSYGKRDVLDKKLHRSFIKEHTGYMGVKYHIRTDYPVDEIGIDNFPGGYCGINKIEDDKYNLCYLYKRESGKKYKSIKDLEISVLFSNRNLKTVFTNSDFLFEEPEVINEIYFEEKSCIENHIFLCGDAAGLITPICGNGMAMAIHSADILSTYLAQYLIPGKRLSAVLRSRIENLYSSQWNKLFRNRLKWGRRIQNVSGNSAITTIAIKTIHFIPSLEKWVIKQTHGKSF